MFGAKQQAEKQRNKIHTHVNQPTVGQVQVRTSNITNHTSTILCNQYKQPIDPQTKWKITTPNSRCMAWGCRVGTIAESFIALHLRLIIARHLRCLRKSEIAINLLAKRIRSYWLICPLVCSAVRAQCGSKHTLAPNWNEAICWEKHAI